MNCLNCFTLFKISTIVAVLINKDSFLFLWKKPFWLLGDCDFLEFWALTAFFAWACVWWGCRRLCQLVADNFLYVIKTNGMSFTACYQTVWWTIEIMLTFQLFELCKLLLWQSYSNFKSFKKLRKDTTVFPICLLWTLFVVSIRNLSQETAKLLNHGQTKFL